MVRAACSLFWVSAFVLGSALGAEATELPLRYARNFTVESYGTHRILTVRNAWRGAEGKRFVYALVPKESETLPDLPEDAVIIRSPVERIATMATIYLGYVQALQLHDKLIAHAYLDFTNDLLVRKGVQEGKIAEIKAGAALDVESMMLLKPDLILTSSTGSSLFDAYPKLQRSGLPVVLTAGYMEKHPLARAEWVLFIACFVDRLEDAQEHFDQIAARYEELAQLTASLEERPTVFANAPYAGQWHQPGGQSYFARALSDAGASYVWADDATAGGIPMDFERVFRRAADVEFWLNPSGHRSLRSLLSVDERFGKFKAFREGNVYNNTRLVSPGGGKGIWERGIAHPEEALADLIKIFHPALLPRHEFVFYEQLK